MKISFPMYVLICVCCNRALVSSSILTSLRGDSSRLRIFNDLPNDFEYVLKRHKVDKSDGTDSKERRSHAGSSFIRFGRSEGESDVDATLGNNKDLKVSRHPRWKSPEIVIRYGRSDFKNDPMIGQLRNGLEEEMLPMEIDPATICADLLSNDERADKEMLRFYVPRLFRFCKKIAEEKDNNDALFLLTSKQVDTKSD